MTVKVFHAGYVIGRHAAKTLAMDPELAGVIERDAKKELAYKLGTVLLNSPLCTLSKEVLPDGSMKYDASVRVAGVSSPITYEYEYEYERAPIPIPTSIGLKNLAVEGIKTEEQAMLTEQEGQTMAEFWETESTFNGVKSIGAKEIREAFEKVYVLVDGDIVAYRAAAAADGRYYEVGGTRFKYSADAKAYADKKSISNSEIISNYEPEPVENALHTVNTTMDMIEEWFLTRERNPIIITCLSCERNFRYDLWPEYKANRKQQRRPEHLKACKEHLIAQHKGRMFHPYEADDLIAMTAVRLTSEGHTVSIASNDKDFTQLGRKNLSFYDFTTGKSWWVTEEEAARYYYKQLLIGDTSDGVDGIPGVGSQTAIKILEECKSAKEMDAAVFWHYTEYYMKKLHKGGSISEKLQREIEEAAEQHIMRNIQMLLLLQDETTLEEVYGLKY